MKRSIAFIAAFSILMLVQAQSKRQQLKKMGTIFYQEDFKEILDMCVQFEKEFPEETDHLYYKYIAEMLTFDRGGDINRLLEFEASKGKTDKFYNYWLGRIHLSRYEFEDAKEHLQAFLELDVYKSPIILKETTDMLDMINKAIPYYNEPDEYELERLPDGINTLYSEISPAFFNGHDELIFASNRNPKDSYHEADYYTIYHSEKKGRIWSDPAPLISLGSFSYENAKVEVINRDNRLYLYSPEDGGNIMYSDFKDNSWSLPKVFDTKLKNRHVESHFFINDQEDYILFVKDKDIWETRKLNNGWTEPRPIPGRINSIYEEESPFLSHSGTTLFFSSNRSESMGGFDVFRAEFDSTIMGWGDAINMGFPINTIDNDINFEVTPSDQSGYLSSDRLHSLGEYDIYYFHKEDKIRVRGVVTDTNTGRPASGVEVRFLPIVYEDEVFRAVTNSKGEFVIPVFNREKFETQVSIQGEVLHRGTFESYIPTDRPDLTKNFEVQVPAHLKAKTNYATLYQGEKEDSNVDLEMLGSKFRGGRKAIINNIYFDFQSSRIKPESREVLSKIYETLLRSPDLTVEIGGHTDNIGTHEYNMQLSQERANAVRIYLIDQGIDPGRLKAVGYGETTPLASNDDEINGRELNRRIEIRVLE
ncbi:OmpA family protein [Marinoscillum sp.]|uniref:OmpA family protein n=1 Tax=Marinoscillum sp. TaxID=2024838 RepID=UPI003BAA85C0